MKLYLALALFISVALAAESDFTLKKADNDFIKKQAKVLSLYIGLGSDLEPIHHHKYVDFPYNDAKYYKDPHALSKFMKSYDRGLIDKHGVFTMYCHKNRHDTFNIFDIMYYAKDFETMYNIAKWARDELNPIQFFYTYSMAVLHREDTRGIYVPPVFEVLPHYFVQSYYMNEAIAYKTFHTDDQVVVHTVNNTGWNKGWHFEMTGGIYPTGQRWNGDDFISRISYFREDVGLANSFYFRSLRFPPWVSTEKYPDIHFAHRGEYEYSFYKWILDRYTLERMSYYLPSLTYFETDKPMPGYNSHLTDYMGRSFLSRSDNIVPVDSNPEASWEVDTIEERIQKAIDLGSFWDKNGAMNITDRKGFETFAKMIYATRDSFNRPYYKSLYFSLLAAAKDVVKAPNDREFTSSPLGFKMTQLRDPAYYMILGTIESWFEDFVSSFKPYSQEQLGFSGVTFDKFEVSKLMTYNTRRKFEITNGLSFQQKEDRFKFRSFANQYILDHMPFEYDFTINSDKDQDAMIRVFLGPKRDTDGRFLSLNQQRRAFIPINKYIVNLKSGENVFKKSSFQPEFYDTHDNFYDIYLKVNKSLYDESETPFEYSELTHCGMPYNLQLPRGWRDGKEYTMFVMVTPYSQDKIHKDGFYQCHHNMYMDDYSLNFPFDRKIKFPKKFHQPNMIFKDVKIFHSFTKPKDF